MRQYDQNKENSFEFQNNLIIIIIISTGVIIVWENFASTQSPIVFSFICFIIVPGHNKVWVTAKFGWDWMSENAGISLVQ